MMHTLQIKSNNQTESTLVLQTPLLPLLKVQNRLESFKELCTTIPTWAYMGKVVFATSLHVGICRMVTTLFGDDIAQKSVIRILW